jgi:hypothetical protein
MHGHTCRFLRRARLAFGLALLVIGAVVATPAAASVQLTVCPTGCQYTTIGAALAAAQDGDKIVVGSGTYDGGLSVDKDVTLRGKGADVTTISLVGTGTSGSVVTVAPGTTVTIDGVTITGGAAQLGAGVKSDGELTLKDTAVVQNNGSGIGAAGTIYNGADGTLSLVDTYVAENTVVDGIGGGIYNAGAALIKGSVIHQNGAEFVGAGIYNDLGATMRLFDTVVSGNLSGFSAGGIENRGVLDVRGSQITGNVAQTFGGGLLNEGEVEVTATDVVGNTATWGGALYNSGTATLRASTVSGNVAQLEGGGIYNVGQVGLFGTRVSGNEPDDCLGC